MEEDNLRYSGGATHPRHFMREFLVECPKCFRSALVKLDNPFSTNDGLLFCSNCSHKENSNDRIRYKLIVKRNCDTCGKAFKKILPDHKEKIEEVKIACPECGTQRAYKPLYEEYKLMYDQRRGLGDPVFNLPLWLQAEVKENLFWAFNREHLNAIKEYVQSKLRERQTTYFTTMVEKLPKFIKEAKNRSLLLKIIERLEKK